MSGPHEDVEKENTRLRKEVRLLREKREALNKAAISHHDLNKDALIISAIIRCLRRSILDRPITPARPIEVEEGNAPQNSKYSDKRTSALSKVRRYSQHLRLIQRLEITYSITQKLGIVKHDSATSSIS